MWDQYRDFQGTGVPATASDPRWLKTPSLYAILGLMTRTFAVVLVPQPEGGFFVECPALPGCYSQGESVQEALDNIREAILLAIEDLEATDETVPEGGAPLVTQVQVSA